MKFLGYLIVQRGRTAYDRTHTTRRSPRPRAVPASLRPSAPPQVAPATAAPAVAATAVLPQQRSPVVGQLPAGEGVVAVTDDVHEPAGAPAAAVVAPQPDVLELPAVVDPAHA